MNLSMKDLVCLIIILIKNKKSFKAHELSISFLSRLNSALKEDLQLKTTNK